MVRYLRKCVVTYLRIYLVRHARDDWNFEAVFRAGESGVVLPYIKYIGCFWGCQARILLFCHIVLLSYVVEYCRTVILYFCMILFLRAEERKGLYYGVI